MMDLKRALRKSIIETISKLSKEDKQIQSEKVRKKLFALPAFQKSKLISVYLSTENEIDTEPIVRRIFENNKICYIPRYDKKKMEMVRLNSMEDWQNLPLTKWNIKQPKLSEVRENAMDTGGLDLIIVPGVAFTRNGRRLGHGGGYYDKYLSKIAESERKIPVTVGLGFKEQYLDDLPHTEHDFKIDIVLTSH